MSRTVSIAFAVAAISMLANCTTATPYQPLTTRGPTTGGYTDAQLENDRYRVTFSGNSMTSRETVENYLLYRAAELTVSQGYDWFVMAERDTERKSRTVVDQPFSSGAYGFWGPSWRYHGHGLGWRSWDPYWGDPFWDRQIDVRTIDRYEASAEVVFGKGRTPRNNFRAFDARQILSSLRSRLVTPE